MFAVAMRTMSIRPIQRSPIAFGWLCKSGMPRVVVDHYLPLFRRAGSTRRDLIRFLRGVGSEPTLRVAAAFGQVVLPVLVAWSREDRVFPFAHAEQLAALIPQAALAACDDAYAYLPFDQPAWLEDQIIAFHQGLR